MSGTALDATECGALDLTSVEDWKRFQVAMNRVSVYVVGPKVFSISFELEVKQDYVPLHHSLALECEQLLSM